MVRESLTKHESGLAGDSGTFPAVRPARARADDIVGRGPGLAPADRRFFRGEIDGAAA
jgi:hypothetical protein